MMMNQQQLNLAVVIKMRVGINKKCVQDKLWDTLPIVEKIDANCERKLFFTLKMRTKNDRQRVRAKVR